MPTLASMVIPKPKSWKEFQDITLSALRIKWSTTSLTPNGRDGQPQQGVDFYGDDDLGRFVGVQCKLTEKDEIDKSTIIDEINKADGTHPNSVGKPFEPPLSVFYIATSAPSDAKIQKEIRLISSERIKGGKFAVGIFFWDDLIQELVKNETEFHAHYPQLSLISQEVTNKRARLLSILDIGYYGANISFLVVEIGVEYSEILTLINIVESCASILFDSQGCFELSTLKQLLIDGLQLDKDEYEIRQITQAIEQKVLNLQYTLTDSEILVFFIGLTLARWEQIIVNNKVLNQQSIDDFLVMLQKFADEKIFLQVVEKLVNYSKGEKESLLYVDLPVEIRAIVKKMIYGDFLKN